MKVDVLLGLQWGDSAVGFSTPTPVVDFYSLDLFLYY